MNVVQQLQYDRSVSSLAFDATGDHVAVAVGMSARYLLRPPHEPTEPQGFLYRLSDGQFLQYATMPLYSHDGSKAKWEEGKVAFLDERTLLVASKLVRSVTDQDVVLLALDLPTGQERGRWTHPGFFEHISSDLIPLPPRHALLSLINTVMCVNVEEYQEVCSAREVDDGDVVEEGASPEEQLAPNGLAHDATTGRTYLFCRAYGEAILLRCRLDLSARAFVREARLVFPERQDRVGLCLTPGGGLTALFQIADDWVDLSGRTVIGDADTRARLLVQPRPAAPPRMTRLGSLVLFPPDLEGEPRRVDFSSDFARDFTSEPCFVDEDAGQSAHVGYRLTAGDVNLMLAHGDFLTGPVYISATQVVLGTPSGFLLCVDTATGHSRVIHDFHSRINTLQFHAEKRLLLAGCESGALTVLDV